MNPLHIVEVPLTHTIPAVLPRNKLLAALPPSDYQRLANRLVFQPVRAREVLLKDGQLLNSVYFLDRSVCSLTYTMENGASVEVAMIGNEGLIGVDAICGNPVAHGDVVVRYADGAHVLDRGVFEEEMSRRGAFYDVIMRYLQAFVGVLGQSVACNGLHTAHQRCCRWLLMTQDLLGAAEFPLTHEMLASMLGVRRPTVTLLLAELAKAQIIGLSRGRLRILDRPALEISSCECYGAIKRVYERLAT